MGLYLQTVTVTALEDADAVDESVTITHMAVIDEDEVALRDATVTVHIEDPGQQRVLVEVSGITTCPDDTPQCTLPPLSVSEASAAASYTVNLDSRPTGTVTVTVDKGRDAGEVSVSPSRLVFYPSDWDGGSPPLAKMVEVYAGQDFDADDDRAFLAHKVNGADYTNVSAASVEVLVTDTGSTRGITVSPPTLNIPVGTSRSFSIKLDTQPKGTVKIDMENPEENVQVTLSPKSVSFNSRNWNTPKSVTVRATSSALTPHTPAHPAVAERRGGVFTLSLDVDPNASNNDDAYNDLWPLSRSPFRIRRYRHK